MKVKKPTLKQVQAVRCPTCGAGPGEKCELSTGQPRTEPHRDRRLISKDWVSRLRSIWTRWLWIWDAGPATCSLSWESTARIVSIATSATPTGLRSKSGWKSYG